MTIGHSAGGPGTRTGYAPASSGRAGGAERWLVASWWVVALFALALVPTSGSGTDEVSGSAGPGGRTADAAEELRRPTVRPDPTRRGLGRTVPPAGVFVDVAVARWQSCGVRDTGELACWGEVDPLPPAGRFSAVSAARDGSRLCALGVDGAAVCWAPGASGVVRPQGRYSQVSADAGCGVLADGGLRCWPDADAIYGARGSGEGSAAGGSAASGSGGVLFEDPPEGRFDRVAGIGSRSPSAASSGPVCALDVEGVLACWADGANFGRSRVPDGRFVALDSNARESCALRVEGDVVCWQRSIGTSSVYGLVAVPLGARTGEFVDVAVGDGHACALSAAGDMECWGDNSYGQGDVYTGPFTGIAVDARNSCALRRDGQVSCWGESSRMRTDGAGETGRWDSPGGRFVSVGVAGGIACAVRDDTELVCWGYRSSSADGRDRAVDSERDWWVDRRPRGQGFAEVWLKYALGCVLRTDDTVECWTHELDPQPLEGSADTLRLITAGRDGYPGNWTDGYCTLRDNGEPHCSDPDRTALLPSGGFTDLDAAAQCGVRLDGRIECWGYHDNHTSPAGLGPFLDAAVTPGVICGVQTGARVACWDRATLEPPQDRRFLVAFRGGVTRFAEGRFYCAIGTGGRLVGLCDIEPRPGDGPGLPDTLKAPSGPVTDAAFSRSHACAVLADGRATCWGAPYEDPGLVAPSAGICYRTEDGTWNCI